MSDWLELELADRLAPTEAPEALWSAIEKARMQKQIRTQRPKWPVAAVATAILALGVVWLRPNLPQPLQARAATGLVLHTSTTATPVSSNLMPEASCHLCHNSL